MGQASLGVCYHQAAAAAAAGMGHVGVHQGASNLLLMLLSWPCPSMAAAHMVTLQQCYHTYTILYCSITSSSYILASLVVIHAIGVTLN